MSILEEKAALEKYGSDDMMPIAEFGELTDLASLIGRAIAATMMGVYIPKETAALVLDSLQAAREMGRRAGEKAEENRWIEGGKEMKSEHATTLLDLVEAMAGPESSDYMKSEIKLGRWLIAQYAVEYPPMAEEACTILAAAILGLQHTGDADMILPDTVVSTDDSVSFSVKTDSGEVQITITAKEASNEEGT